MISDKSRRELEVFAETTRGSELYTAELQKQMAVTMAREDVRQFLGGGASGGWLEDAGIPENADPPSRLFTTTDDCFGAQVPGRCYGYPAAVHWMYGSRASGKTFIGLLWAAQEIAAGREVLWYAFEHQRDMRARLKMCGAEKIDGMFRYRQARGRPSAEDVEKLAAHVRETGTGLVVFDAMRGLMGACAPGASSNDGDAVELVNSGILVPLAAAGASVLVIDHRPKDGATAIGSERKETLSDVVLAVECKQPFSRDTAGWSQVTVTKDRPGWNGEGDTARLIVRPGALRFEADTAPAATSKADMEDRRKDAIREALKARPYARKPLAVLLEDAHKDQKWHLTHNSWVDLIERMIDAGELAEGAGPRRNVKYVVLPAASGK